MKYFFLIYAIVAALVIGMLPQKGDRFSQPPLRLFPDMDEQDRLDAQEPDDFFADGVGNRHPVAGTRPIGFQPDGTTELGGIHDYEFGGGSGYYFDGKIDDYYANGMPEELGLTADNAESFLRRGAEMFSVNCTPCHGASGDGQGIAGQFGVPGIANLVDPTKASDAYPDGRLYDVITNGKGQMGAYKHNLSVRDRWAVVAYVRALQAARSAPLDHPAVQAAFTSARQRGEIEGLPAEPAAPTDAETPEDASASPAAP